MEAAHWRMRKLNEILPPLQEKFESALNRGQLLRLELTAGTTVDELLEAALAEDQGR